MKKTILKKYDRLIAECGANVQKGQEVFVYAGLDQPEFIKMLVDAIDRHWEYINRQVTLTFLGEKTKPIDIEK